MPTFTLWRTFAPSMTAEDFEMMQVRAIATWHFQPSFQWQRSFDLEPPDLLQGFCVYEGPSLQDLHWQQRVCWIPFDEIREVREIRNQLAGPGKHEVPPGWSLYLVERQFAHSTSAADIVNLNERTATPGSAWFRSYWDADRATSKCIFAAESEAAIAAVVRPADGSTLRFCPILEGHPADCADTYDTLGVPRHWESSPG